MQFERGLIYSHERGRNGKGTGGHASPGKREVAEWLLSQIEDQIPKDFFLALRQTQEAPTLSKEAPV
jgi:hypothetical protein